VIKLAVIEQHKGDVSAYCSLDRAYALASDGWKRDSLGMLLVNSLYVIVDDD
jgi:hypothetical protein